MDRQYRSTSQRTYHTGSNTRQNRNFESNPQDDEPEQSFRDFRAESDHDADSNRSASPVDSDERGSGKTKLKPHQRVGESYEDYRARMNAQQRSYRERKRLGQVVARGPYPVRGAVDTETNEAATNPGTTGRRGNRSARSNRNTIPDDRYDDGRPLPEGYRRETPYTQDRRIAEEIEAEECANQNREPFDASDMMPIVRYLYESERDD